jgi:hypothetical protein
MIGGSGGSGGCLATQSTTVPNTQFKYSVQQVENGDANGNSMVAAQRIEASIVRPYIGKTLTLSLWVRFTGLLPTTQLIISTPSSGVEDTWQVNEPLGETNQFTSLPSLTLGVWKRVSFTFVVPAAASNGLQVMLATASYSGIPTMNHTGWMLTEGPSAPANFYRAGATIEEELAMCQRYFFRTATNPTSGATLGGTQPVCMMQAHTTGAATGILHFPTTMRAIPTASFNSAGGTNFVMTDVNLGARNVSAISSAGLTANAHWINASAPSMTIGAAANLYGVNPQIAHSAEL